MVASFQRSMKKHHLGLVDRAGKTLKDPAGNFRFQIGFGSKAAPNQAQNTRRGARKPAHNDFE